MLLTLIIPIIILSLTLSVHYHQHFKLRLCSSKPPNKQSTLAPTKSLNPRDDLRLSPHQVSMSVGTVQFQLQQNKKKKCVHSCGCSLRSKDDEKFDFFPASFFYYIIFQICLCSLMIIMHCIDYYDAYNTINIHIFHKSVHSPINNILYTIIDNIQMKQRNNKLQLSQHTYIDYILIYSIMILLIWESLFSFWKYYSTKIVCEQYALVNTYDIIRRFALYAAAFCTMFVLLLHVHYLFYTIVLLAHCGFNLRCTMKFASILIQKYRLFMEIEDKIEENDNESIIRNVYAMRNLSIACNILSTIYLALFSVSYSVHTIYYLPIIWCLSSAIFSLNFIRNRKFFFFKLFELKQRLSSRRYKVFPRRYTSTETDTTEIDKHITSGVNEKTNDEHIAGVPITTKFSSVDTESAAATDDKFIEESIDARPLPIYRVHTKKQRSKALQLLGIGLTPTRKVERRIAPQMRPIHLVYSQSDIIANRSGTISEMYREQNVVDKHHHRHRFPAKKKMKTSQSDITDANKRADDAYKAPTLESIVDIEEESDVFDESSAEHEPYIPRTPLRRLSSGAVAITMPDTTKVVTFNVKDIDYVDDDDGDEEELVYIDYAAHKPLGGLVIDADSEQIFIDAHNNNNTNYPEPPLALKHHKSTSEPVDVQQISNNMNVDQIMDSLNLIAKYGFCSRHSINSLYQLRQLTKIKKEKIES